MQTYKPGQVSELLFASTKKSKKTKFQNDSLAQLFSPHGAPTWTSNDAKLKVSKAEISPVQSPKSGKTKENVLPTDQMKKKKKKKVKEDGTKEETADSGGQNSQSPFPFIHESLLPKKTVNASVKVGVKRKLSGKKKDDDDDDVVNNKRPRRDRQRDKVADNRTVFVGNCPVSVDKKRLKALFKEYGSIESMRFRCAPAADPNLPKRAIAITKQFHEQVSSYVAYIVFKEEQAAQKALARNGHEIDGLHLRVDIAAMSKKHDKKRSVFVGNLPFTIDEESLRSHFSDCGDITNVRIVRDRQTSLGKGISYIQFESKDSASLAQKLNNSELQGRAIRVMGCVNKPKKKEEKKNKKTAQTDKKSDRKLPKDSKKKISFGPSNATSSSAFKSMLKLKKEKKFRKQKKKKENAKKSDGLSSIFGDVGAPTGRKSKVKKSKPGQKAKPFKTRPSGHNKGKKQKGSTFKGKGKVKGKKKN